MRRALTSLPQVLAESSAKKIQVKILALRNTMYISFDNFKNRKFWEVVAVLANGIYQCLLCKAMPVLRRMHFLFFDADPTVSLVRVQFPCFKKMLNYAFGLIRPPLQRKAKNLLVLVNVSDRDSQKSGSVRFAGSGFSLCCLVEYQSNLSLDPKYYLWVPLSSLDPWIRGSVPPNLRFGFCFFG